MTDVTCFHEVDALQPARTTRSIPDLVIFLSLQDPDIEAEVMGAATGLKRAQRELTELQKRLDEFK